MMVAMMVGHSESCGWREHGVHLCMHAAVDVLNMWLRRRCAIGAALDGMRESWVDDENDTRRAVV